MLKQIVSALFKRQPIEKGDAVSKEISEATLGTLEAKFELERTIRDLIVDNARMRNERRGGSDVNR